MAILVGTEIKQLISGGAIDSLSATAQAVYTAPAAKKVVITGLTLRCTAAVSVTVGATVKVEINPAAGDVFTAEILTNVLVVDDQWSFTAEARGLVIPAGAQVDVTVTNAATGTSQTLTADLIGYVIF